MGIRKSSRVKFYNNDTGEFQAEVRETTVIITDLRYDFDVHILHVGLKDWNKFKELVNAIEVN